MDTIFAQATAPGKAGVAVIRVSGPLAFEVGRKITGKEIAVGRHVLRHLTDHDGTHIDTALCLAFEAGASFTGEDTIEFHIHGSVAVARALSRTLIEFDGVRPADPGEFTRRALENERLDLVQVEGLGDLIEAETELQRRQAQKTMTGGIGQLVEAWRERLLRAVALVEATIDFADEELPDTVLDEADALLSELQNDFRKELSGSIVSERIREGFEIALVGSPNSGKSTLLNALAGREAAITSDIAGTTRDVIEVRLDLSGLPVTVLDTAGLRETDDPVERIGVDRARERAHTADIRVFLVHEDPVPDFVEARPGDLWIGTKSDLAIEAYGRPVDMEVSALAGTGLNELMQALSSRLMSRVADASVISHERQRVAIESVLAYVQAAQRELQGECDRTERAAEELYGAIRSLDVLVGRVDVEQVLDVIFASFCMGK